MVKPNIPTHVELTMLEAAHEAGRMATEVLSAASTPEERGQAVGGLADELRKAGIVTLDVKHPEGQEVPVRIGPRTGLTRESIVAKGRASLQARESDAAVSIARLRRQIN